MKDLKGYLMILGGAILLLLILVIVRTVSPDNFRNDAAKWAEKSINGENLIDSASLSTVQTDILLINTGSKINYHKENISELSINPEKIFEKANLKSIRHHRGTKVIVSDDTALAARLWMLLSQTGIRDLYILK